MINLFFIFLSGDLLCYHNSSLQPRWFGGGQRTSVSLKSAYIHPRLVWCQVCGSCSRRRRRWEVWRTGQAGVFRKKLN